MKFFTTRVVLVLLSLATFSHAFAANYYVNSNSGNDNLDGKAPAVAGPATGPWQNLSRLATTALAPGDTVYLACGSLWSETLQLKSSGTVAAPITIAAGPGACSDAPTIDGTSLIPAHAWERYKGNIYRAKLPIDLMTNPGQSPSVSKWAPWAASGDATMVVANPCPGQADACLAFTTGSVAANNIASSNYFKVASGMDYTASVQVRAVAGTRMRVLVRRGGPSYESLAPSQSVIATGNWQSVQIAFRATGAVSNARMDVELHVPRTLVHIRDAHFRQPLFGGDVAAAFVDKLLVRPAHHPNFVETSGVTSPYATVVNGGTKTYLDVAGLVLPAGAALANNLSVTIRTNNYTIEEREVIALGGTRLTLLKPTHYNIQPGYGYFLTGALWMLDSPGEWFYDAAASMFYVWMPDGSNPGTRVGIGSLPAGIDLVGKANVVVRNIAIRGVGNGVTMTAASGISLSGVSIADVADYGVNASACGQCTVQSSSIARTGLDAVNAPGSAAPRFTLADSSIIDSGGSTRTDGWRTLPRPTNAAVFAIGAQATVTRNTINGSAYHGVVLGADGKSINNYVGNSCRVLNDCGAIYTNFSGGRNVITGNVVENAPGNIAGVPPTLPTHTVGIYLDDHNVSSVVSGNTVLGADYGVQVHNSNGATISNNVLYGNRRHQLWMQETSAVLRAAGDVFNNRVESNLLVPSARGTALFLESRLGATNNFATFLNNRYSGMFSPQVIGEQSPTSAASFTVADWSATGRETSPQLADPGGYASFLVGQGNLVPNGDFSNVVNPYVAWRPWNQTAPFATSTVQNCSFGPCLQLYAGSTITLVSSPSFSIVGGQWYRLTFDAITETNGQAIHPMVRRGGGGTNTYESLMPAEQKFTGANYWKRYSFSFQATKSVNANDPITRDNGARLDFEKNSPGSILGIANVELVPISPGTQVASELKLLLNRQNASTVMNCASVVAPGWACTSFIHLKDGVQVTWPAQVASLSGRPVSTRDTSLSDIDGDGIADRQDFCPGTPVGQYVNARGCGINQE